VLLPEDLVAEELLLVEPERVLPTVEEREVVLLPADEPILPDAEELLREEAAPERTAPELALVRATLLTAVAEERVALDVPGV